MLFPVLHGLRLQHFLIAAIAPASLSTAQAQLTYQLASSNASWPAAKRTAIISAMEAAVAVYNANGYFPKNLTANYSASVPTAQANYSGWIDFGGSISTRVALHEISHTLGVGTYWNWDPKVNTGKWTGNRALARMALFDGTGSVLNCDGTHFWPYGLNYDYEDSTTNRVRHVKMVSALRWDMGIVTDSDSDGMPDDWEIFHFGNLAQNATGDWDADGSNNLAEYNADTTPGTSFSFTWNGGTGVWDTITANWTGPATFWRNGGNDTATFGGAAGTVTVGTGISANDLTFNTNGYVVSGSGLELSGIAPSITAAAGVTVSMAPVLTGSRGLVKNGAGRLTLGGANTFTGPITVNAGTLVIAPGGRLYMNGGSTVTTIKSGGTLSFSGNWGWNGTLRYMGVKEEDNIIDGGTLQHTGTSNAKTSEGAGRLFTIGAAGAILDSATAGEEFTIGYRTDYGDALASSGGNLTLTGEGNGELNYNLPGSGGLLKRGSGIWRLTGSANSFSGGTTIGVSNNQGSVGGILVATDSTSLGSGPVIVIAGDLTNTNLGAQLQLAGGITLSNSPVTISGFGFGTANGVIRNVSGNNALSGNIQLTSGAGGSIISSDTGKLTLSGGITTIAGSRTLEFNGAGNIDVTGSINNGSTAALPVTKSGSGTLIFTGTNTYSGITTLSEGILQIGAGAAAGTLGTANVVNNSTLRFHRSDTALQVTQGISGTGGVEFGVDNGGMLAAETTLSGANSFSGPILVRSGGVRITRSDALGSGTKIVTMTNGTNGVPRLILDGSNGPIVLPSNINFITSNANATMPAVINQAGDNTIEGNFSLMSGGGSTRIRVDGGTLILSGLITPAVSGRTLQLDGAGNGNFNGVLQNGSNSVGLEKFGTGTWTLRGANTFTGTTTIHDGTLRIGASSGAATSGALPASAIVNNSSLVFRRTNTTSLDLSGAISGSGNVTYEGSGTLNESQYSVADANTYSGGTGIGACRVAIGNANSLGSGSVNISNGGQIFVNAAVILPNTFTLSGDGWLETAGRLGALRLATGAQISGPIILAGKSRLCANGVSATLAGGISGPHSLELGEDTTTGTVVLAGANTHTGNTTVSFGTLELAATGSMYFAPSTNGVCNQVNGSGNAIFKGSFIIDLTNTSISHGNSWPLVSAPSLNEAYAATFNIPGFTEAANVWTRIDGERIWTFRESTGQLSLAVMVAGSFESWIASFSGLTDASVGGDPDRDGITNLLEYVLGGHPGTVDPSILPRLDASGSNFVFAFTRREQSINGSTQVFEYGSDLAGWTALKVTAPTHSSVILGQSSGGLQTVTITLPKTLAESSGRLFGRLRVSQP